MNPQSPKDSKCGQRASSCPVKAGSSLGKSQTSETFLLGLDFGFFLVLYGLGFRV